MNSCSFKCLTGICRGRICVVTSLTVVFATAIGCAHQPAARPDRAAVSGTVKYNGKPVPGGRLIFISAKDPNESASCLIQESGAYAVGDAPIGEARVTIDTESLKPELGERYVQIPATYSAVQSTSLTHTIVPGENTADFDLK